MFRRSRLGTSLMLAFGGGIAVGSLPAFAQVVITGSSIKQIEASTALPVQTLTRADIDRTGVQTTEQLMRTISAMSSSGQTQTSTGVNVSTYGLNTVSLRGLGEERTLVLLNGRRLAPFASGSSAVNIGNIPLSAIERVEVLKDGASAIYGSDAEAGVVNFILKKNFQGYEVGGTAGTPTTSGGGQQYIANIVAGWGDQTSDGWNLTVSGQYQRNQNLKSSDRKYSKSGENWPTSLPTATGQGNIAGPWAAGVPVPDQSADYLGVDGFAYGSPLGAAGQCAQINHLPANPNFPFSDYPYCVYDSAAYLNLMAQTENFSFTGNFTFRLNDKAEVYADALWSQNEVTTQIQPSPLRTSFMETDDLFRQQGVDPVLLLRPGNPNYQRAADYLNSVGLGSFVGQDLGITARVFDFGPRVTKDTSTQSRFLAGVRGEVLEQWYDVAVAYNESKLEGKVTEGFFSQIGYAKATQDPTSDWNPWSMTQSQNFMNLIAPANYAGPTMSSKSTMTTVDAALSGDVAKLPAGMMQYAVGYQYRGEALKLSPSAALAGGDIAGLGGATKPVDADRNLNAVFGELNIPVVKNLDANLAARWDNYSDVGTTTNWKGGLRWQPMQQVLVRGSYGTGFRAPSLNNLFEPVVNQSSTTIQDPDPNTAFVGQVNELTGGNKNLQPETSTQWGLGLIFQPLPSLAFGVDYFNITVDDAISQPTTQEVLDLAYAGDPKYVNKVIRGANGMIQQVINLPDNNGKLSTEGVDVDLRYREKLGPGTLSLSLDGTYYFKYEQSTPAMTSQKVATMIGPNSTPVISSTIGLDGFGVILRYKQYLSATWSQGDWATTVGNSFALGYYGGWNWLDEPTRMPTQTIWDLQVAYTGLKNTVLTLGARNLFDKQPASFSTAYIGSQFQEGYDSSQYDPRGRFVYATATFRF